MLRITGLHGCGRRVSFPVRAQSRGPASFRPKRHLCESPRVPTAADFTKFANGIYLVNTQLHEKPILMHASELERYQQGEKVSSVFHHVQDLQKHPPWENLLHFQFPPGFSNKVKYFYGQVKKIGWAFWYGTKQLYHNTKLANQNKKLGDKQSLQQVWFYRQNRQDLKAIVPFFLVWRIPFLGDFVLPAFIMRYPHLLPSTFKLVHPPPVSLVYERRLDKRTQILKKASLPKDVYDSSKIDHMFASHLDSVFTNIDLLNSGPKLSEQIKVEKLDRTGLQALCAIFGISTFGPTFLLKRRLNAFQSNIKLDDKLISNESVESLSEIDLLKACMDRGLEIRNTSILILQHQLKQWLKISAVSTNSLFAAVVYAHLYKKKTMALLPCEPTYFA